LLIANLYDLRPSEVIDPFFECSFNIRDEIDLSYKVKHEKRILSILKGETPIGKKPVSQAAPIDPYPKPRNCDVSILQKGGKFLKKMAREAGWM
jgi:hypothetical protein